MFETKSSAYHIIRTIKNSSNSSETTTSSSNLFDLRLKNGNFVKINWWIDL